MEAAPPTSTGNSTRVGFKSAVAVVIGNMIGTSIYISVGYQALAGHSQQTILLLWTVGALLAMAGALCYAELAAAFPRSGGEYHFLNQAYPPMVGFLSGWIAMIAGFPIPIAIGALSLGQYLVVSFTGNIPGEGDLMVKGIALAVIVIVTAMHSLTLRSASRFHGFNTALKILLLAVLVVGGFLAAPSPQALPWSPQINEWSLETISPFFVSLFYVLYAYAGWNSATYISGEINNPQRNVPRALLMGIGIVFVLYLSLMAAFLRVTPGAELAASQSAAPLVAATYMFGPDGGRVIGFCISLGMISFISGMVWAGPRISQRMGQDYRFLAPLGRTTQHGIPRNAILLQSVIALVAVALFDDPSKLMVYVEFLLQISVFLTVLSVIILRVKRPDLPRPIKTWGYPITPIIFLIWTAFAMGIFLKSRQTEAIHGLATLLAGMLIFVICKAEERVK